MTTRPDSPCIGVCDILYEDYCSGCGRHYTEAALWVEMSQPEKDAVWQRIETEGKAWRFNKYSERANA